MKQILLFFFIFVSFGQIYSQTNTNEQKIKTVIEDYFQLEREKIYVQFNKSQYVSDEKIAFKGYIFNAHNNLPNIKTTNIHLVIYDKQGKVIQKQLLWGSNGTFEGIVELSDSIASGKYRFQFYTNWMNNFKEDESYTDNIEIISKNENYQLNSSEPNYKTATISIFPESGTFLKDIKNAVGIQVKDCNQKGIHVRKGSVLDSKGNTVAQFFTNKMGYGRFDLEPTTNETYTVQIINDQLDIKQQLPLAQNSGLIISPKNNFSDNTLVVAIQTNSNGLALYQNKNYTLVVHQNGNSVLKSFNFDDKKQTQIISFDENLLSGGINTIRIIDENNNQVAERLVYIHKGIKVVPALDAVQIANDSITLSGKVSTEHANLSVSILPSETVCLEQNNSILGTYFLNTYLEKPEQSTAQYFDKTNSARGHDLELLLLNKERSKYQWSNMITSKPKELYHFTNGISISGSIIKTLNPKIKYKVLLLSLKNNDFEETLVDSNNKFRFDHYFVQDSTSYSLQLLTENNLPIETKMITNVHFADEAFNKIPLFEAINCTPNKEVNHTFTFNNTNNINVLNEVTVKNKYIKPVLTHQKESSNGTGRGYKISEDTFGNILDYIGQNGYNTGRDSGEVSVISRRNPSAKLIPAIYINDVKLQEFSILYQTNISDVDEIYFNQSTASVFFSGAGGGTIRIYLRKDFSTKNVKQKIATMVVKSGFAQNKTYTTTDYTNPQEFNAFGTLQWAPNLVLDNNNLFSTSFSGKISKEVMVKIEGFTKDGYFISETKKIAITPKS